MSPRHREPLLAETALNARYVPNSYAGSSIDRSLLFFIMTTSKKNKHIMSLSPPTTSKLLENHPIVLTWLYEYITIDGHRLAVSWYLSVPLRYHLTTQSNILRYQFDTHHNIAFSRYTSHPIEMHQLRDNNINGGNNTNNTDDTNDIRTTTITTTLAKPYERYGYERYGTYEPYE